MKIKWDNDAFEEIRRLPAVAADLQARAEAIAAACGDGIEAVRGSGKSRARSAVLTASAAGMIRNAKFNTILSNAGAGRS